jgi:DNA-binding winged helix-turn-helix (wHTH) protein
MLAMSTPGSSPILMQFGVFELDLQRVELRKQGVKVKLQDQPLKVLLLLLETPGQIVSREQLRSRIYWVYCAPQPKNQIPE